MADSSITNVFGYSLCVRIVTPLANADRLRTAAAAAAATATATGWWWLVVVQADKVVSDVVRRKA